MNGEILRHDVEHEAVLEQTVFECLRIAKLQVQPPVQARELIFIKMCRLPIVKMRSAGLEVRGVLSRLDKKIKVRVSALDQDLYWKKNDVTETSTLNEAEKRLLLALAGHLESIRREGGDALHTKLREFLKEKEAGRAPQFWSQQHIQVMMAKAVCRAIAECRPLWLSRPHDPTRTWTPWLGIFVPDDPFDFSAAISFAFTAAETDHEFKDRGAKLARKNARVTSLEVRFDPNPNQIVPKKWINGFWFFNNKSHPRNFVIPWPKWMQ
ncbi:hypothetical protein BGZ60DRAFT_423203 [Tricladium varicosporioides]|nr:hypothetical protein BGZ60DRAFT_423203 [Hymenoscyphus varicosporioides]